MEQAEGGTLFNVINEHLASGWLINEMWSATVMQQVCIYIYIYIHIYIYTCRDISLLLLLSSLLLLSGPPGHRVLPRAEARPQGPEGREHHAPALHGLQGVYVYIHIYIYTHTHTHTDNIACYMYIYIYTHTYIYMYT